MEMQWADFWVLCTAPLAAVDTRGWPEVVEVCVNVVLYWRHGDSSNLTVTLWRVVGISVLVGLVALLSIICILLYVSPFWFV